jgi:tRNA(Arg) A34 adenosine deaminase TadA
MQAMFSTHDEAIHLHAEICAIKNALRTIDQAELSKATLYVARAKYDGCARAKVIQGMAKPCCGCSRALNHYGISRIMYTLDNGDIAIST